MDKFEYKTVTVMLDSWHAQEHPEVDSRLNELGNEGWEVITAVSREDLGFIIYTFKRAILI